MRNGAGIAGGASIQYGREQHRERYIKTELSFGWAILSSCIQKELSLLAGREDMRAWV